MCEHVLGFLGTRTSRSENEDDADSLLPLSERGYRYKQIRDSSVKDLQDVCSLRSCSGSFRRSADSWISLSGVFGPAFLRYHYDIKSLQRANVEDWPPEEWTALRRKDAPAAALLMVEWNAGGDRDRPITTTEAWVGLRSSSGGMIPLGDRRIKGPSGLFSYCHRLHRNGDSSSSYQKTSDFIGNLLDGYWVGFVSGSAAITWILWRYAVLPSRDLTLLLRKRACLALTYVILLVSSPFSK